MSSVLAQLWRGIYSRFLRFLFGRVTFADQEEDLEFRYKLVIVLMTSAALVTGFFIVGTMSAVNPISAAHLERPYSANALATAIFCYSFYSC